MLATYEVGTNLIYAAIHEFGGVIRPINGPFLVFEIDGQVIRARKVTIPARPYMRPAYDTTLAPATAAIGKTFEKLVLAKHYGV